MLLNSYHKERAAAIAAHVSTNAESVCLYVSTFGKYAAGSLYGEWVDLATFDSYDDFIGFCMLLHCDERDPEIMIQDSMGIPFGYAFGVMLGETIDEDKFNKLVDYANLPECERAALDAYCEYHDLCFWSDVEDKYQGYFSTEVEFAEQIANECYSDILEGPLGYYFDYEKFARDLFISDYDFFNGHVFSKY